MRKPDAKARILKTAASLFHRLGYSCVGVNEIIQESDTAKATFYHHFPTKQSLCEAWLEEMHTRSEQSRAALLASPLSPAEKLAQHFDELASFLQRSEFRGCPYTNTAAVVRREEECLVRHIVEHKRSIREFFHQLAFQVTTNPDRAPKLGDALFLLYSGAATEAQNLSEIWPVESARQTSLELCQREG